MMYRIAALLIVQLCLAGTSRAQVDLTRRFEPDGSTVALFHLDDVASGHVANAAGGPPGVPQDVMPTLGRFDGSMSCDGIKGWVDVQQPRDSSGGSGLTVECWVRLRKGAHGDILCRNQSYMMRLDSGLQAYIHLDGAWRKLVGRRPVPTGRWTHLAMTYDRPSKEVRTYIDGRLDVAGMPKGVTQGKLGDGADVLRLGSNLWTPASGQLDGKLDEVRISSVARRYIPLSQSLPSAVPTQTNLIPNPSFEFGLDGWRADGEANTRLEWRVEHGRAPHGQGFLRSTESPRCSLISRPLAILPGKIHTLSAMVRADRAASVRLELCSTGVPRGASHPSRSESMDVTSEWRRVVARFQVPDDWPTELAYVSIGKPAGITLDVDAVNLVAGQGGDFSQTVAQSVGVAADLPPGNLFSRGTPADLSAKIVNSGAAVRSLRADYRITDWLGKETAAGKLFAGPVPAGDAVAVKIPIPTHAVGWFSLTFALSEQGRFLSETTRTINVVEPMTGRGDVFASPLGMNTHMEREPTAHLDGNLSALSRCGVKWIRAWWGWGMAEKQPGKFDWTEYDRQLEAVHRAGMEIMPILLRYYPQHEQAWAGKTDRIQQPPYDLNQWGKFVETTVRRYRGRVKAWEVWNEPIYSIDARTYADLLEVTYQRIKAADPDALVVGFAGVSLDYIRKVFETKGVKNLDVLSHHTYRQLGHPWEQMATLSADTKALVRGHSSSRRPRVWHTEQGTGADGEGYLYLAETEDECAVNLVQSYLSAFSTGVEKFFWFSAQTSPTYGWGVFREDYVPRPRLVALNGLARLLDGRRVTGRMDLGGAQAACVLLDGQAGPAAALWNLDGSLKLTLPARDGLLAHDMLGNPIVVDANGSLSSPRKTGPFSVPLDEGRPVYLTSDRLAANELAEALRRAEISPLDERFPVRASARRAADGGLEIRLENTTGRSLDARVEVACPELFLKSPVVWQLTDLGPHVVGSLTLKPDRRTAAGAKAEATLSLEVGEHGVQKATVKLPVPNPS